MPDVNSIPFRQADPNGHYRSKQLPNDQGDFMLMLGLPEFAGDVVGPAGATQNQVTVFADGTGKRLAAASNTGIAKLTTGVLSVTPAPSGAIVGTTDVQTLTNKTLTNPVITGLTGLTKADVGLANVDNTSDVNKPVSAATSTALGLKEDKGNKAVANGYASLDATGKVPAAQLPASAAAVTSVNTRTGDVVLSKADVSLGNVDNTSDVNKPVSTAQQTALNLKQDTAGKGAVNGYAGLDATGKVPASQLPPSVGGVSSVNTRTGDVVLAKADVGLSNVDNTSDVNKPVSSATTTQLNLKEDKINKGAANGYATLDSTTKVPIAQLPDSVIGASVYQGTWNAATNTPTIPAASAGNKGWYFVVNVAGTTNINGINSWAVGDQIISNGTAWEKIPNVQNVTSVAGRTGAVVLTKTDVGLANVDNTSDVNKPISSATQTALDAKQALSGKGVADGYAGLDSGGKVPAAQLPAVLVTSVNTRTGDVVVTKTDVGLANVDNTSDANKPVSTATQTALNLKENTANKGVASGYASLGADGKVPASQLPATTAPVTSVNSKTGDVVINKTDVVLGNVDNTSDATKNAAVATLTNKTLTSPTINGGTLNSVAMVTPTGITKADVGLSNVDNTSDATKNAAAVTLTNKTLTSPVINTPTGITKADVGLGNVDNTSDATKNSAAGTLTNKIINGANNTLTVRLDADVSNNLPVTRLNSGTGASSTSFWRGDGQWAPPAGGGDVLGPAGSVDGELPLYSGTTGKIVKRCNLTGFVKAASSGAATAQTTMGAADIGTAAITGQTAKATIADADQFLIYDSVSTQLRKAAGSVVLPVGAVVQMAYVEHRAEQNITTLKTAGPFTASDGTALTGMSITFTPLYSNSVLLINAAGYVNAYKNPAGTAGGTIFLVVSGTTNHIADAVVSGYSDGLPMGWSVQLQHTPGAGAKTYSLRGLNNAASGTYNLYINGFGFVASGWKGVTSMTIQEIKQ